MSLLRAWFLLILVPGILSLCSCSTMDEGMTPGDEDWSFIVTGDLQQGFGIFSRLAMQIGELQPVPSATFICGDICLNPGNEVEWLNFRRYSAPVSDKMPIYLARGNHDGNDPGSEEVFRDYVNYPGDQFYTSVRIHQSVFIICDTQIPGEKGSIAGNQLLWLESRLDSASLNEEVENVFIFMHRPLYPQGKHKGQNLLNADELHRLFLSNDKVRAVFAAHDHLFNRYVLDGLPYITTGGGGAALYHGYGGDYHHFTKVSIYENSRRINIRTIGFFNETIENFDL